MNKDCNTQLLEDVVRSTKETSQQVRSAVSFFTDYIANTISEGAFETVLVPYFGKFQPKTKEIQWTAHNKGLERTKPSNDRTIQNNGEARCRDQQTLDASDPGV